MVIPTEPPDLNLPVLKFQLFGMILTGCLSVKVVGMETKGDFDLYRLSLESIQEQESDTVLLYHFRDWPCQAVPNNGLRGITNMYQEVMRSKINQQPTISSVRI